MGDGPNPQRNDTHGGRYYVIPVKAILLVDRDERKCEILGEAVLYVSSTKEPETYGSVAFSFSTSAQSAGTDGFIRLVGAATKNEQGRAMLLQKRRKQQKVVQRFWRSIKSRDGDAHIRCYQIGEQNSQHE